MLNPILCIQTDGTSNLVDVQSCTYTHASGCDRYTMYVHTTTCAMHYFCIPHCLRKCILIVQMFVDLARIDGAHDSEYLNVCAEYVQT